MPTKRTLRARTKEKSYRVLKGFDYPALPTIRARIYAGERIPRGELKRQEAGDKIMAPPSDVLRTLLRRGAVELIEQKEASDDA